MISRHHVGTAGMVETVFQVAQRKFRIVDRPMARVDVTLRIHAQISRACAARIRTVCAAVYLIHGDEKIAEWVSSAGKGFGQRLISAGDHLRQQVIEPVRLDSLAWRR
jgi:hypothetical protein